MSHFTVLVTNTNIVPLAKQLAPTANKKWDWYEIGGRWAGGIRVRNGIFHRRTNIAKVKHLKNITPTFAIVHNGRWYEGGLGRWIVGDVEPPKKWQDRFDSIMKSLEPDSEVTLLDCHM